ncbi:MAG: hypothetical protein GQ552_04545 [Flavobacteriaceae bacterium]|nr:hypothetical protein [Flavobacteriaceae bacterium]
MNEMDKWNELCFILSESVNSNISEQLYELKVIQAFEKLGWSQYKKEISVRESIQLGAAGRIAPDLIIKSHSENKNLFVVEIKKPSANIDYSGFKDQLYSYMRMLKLNFGILIGSKIQIYSDYSDTHLNDLSLIEEYEIEYDNDKGIEFIKLFEKENFEIKKIEGLINEKIKLKENAQLEKSIKKEILSSEYQETIKKLIKSDILKRYDLSSADKIVNELLIKVVDSKIESYSENNPRIKNYPENQRISKPFRITSTTKKTKDGMKIGQYVQEKFRYLFNNNLLTENEIRNLLKEDYSKRTFNQNFKVLRYVSEGTKDDIGNNRYYTREIFGNKYYLTSQWLESHFEYIERWLREINNYTEH